jgi:RNA-directed DNA polymerase
MCQGVGRKGKEVTHILYNIASTPIIRHIKVKGTASPDDSSLREYWDNRKMKQVTRSSALKAEACE